MFIKTQLYKLGHKTKKTYTKYGCLPHTLLCPKFPTTNDIYFSLPLSLFSLLVFLILKNKNNLNLGFLTFYTWFFNEWFLMDKKHLTKVFKEWILMFLQLFSVYPEVLAVLPIHLALSQIFLFCIQGFLAALLIFLWLSQIFFVLYPGYSWCCMV